MRHVACRGLPRATRPPGRYEGYGLHAPLSLRALERGSLPKHLLFDEVLQGDHPASTAKELLQAMAYPALGLHFIKFSLRRGQTQRLRGALPVLLPLRNFHANTQIRGKSTARAEGLAYKAIACQQPWKVFWLRPWMGSCSSV